MRVRRLSCPGLRREQSLLPPGTALPNVGGCPPDRRGYACAPPRPSPALRLHTVTAVSRRKHPCPPRTPAPSSTHANGPASQSPPHPHPLIPGAFGNL